MLQGELNEISYRIQIRTSWYMTSPLPTTNMKGKREVDCWHSCVNFSRTMYTSYYFQGARFQSCTISPIQNRSWTIVIVRLRNSASINECNSINLNGIRNQSLHLIPFHWWHGKDKIPAISFFSLLYSKSHYIYKSWFSNAIHIPLYLLTKYISYFHIYYVRVK